MATETEVGLRIEDFMGVNTQVTSEDLQDQFYLKSQNLYERKIGELQPIGGSVEILPDSPPGTVKPSNITSFRKNLTLYDKFAGKTKIVHCLTTNQRTTQINLPQVVGSFQNDPTFGTWGQTPVGIPNAFIGCYEVQMVAVGFGIFTPLNNPITTNLPVAGETKRFDVDIASAIGNNNITSIELYAKVRNAYQGGTDLYCWIWFGTVDVMGNPYSSPEKYSFNHGPITMSGADPGAPQEVGSGDAVFTANGFNDPTGTLVPGKTYYVSMMSQRLRYQSGVNTLQNKCHYKNNNVVAVTLGRDENAIQVSLSSAASSSTMMALGTHPFNMIPHAVVTNANSGTFAVTRLPVTAGAVNYFPTVGNAAEYVFNASNISRSECWAKIEEGYYSSAYTGTFHYRPIHISQYNFEGSGTGTSQNIGMNVNGALQPHLTLSYTICGLFDPNSDYNDLVGDLSTYEDITRQGNWSTDQYFNATQDLIFMVPRLNRVDPPGSYLSSSDAIFINRNFMYQCDGNVINLVRPAFGHASPPVPDWVRVFKESLVIGGGQAEAWNRLYFTQPIAPYNWGAPGQEATAQFMQIESGGEEISGIGVYTNTTATEGPLAQLIALKPHSTWVISNLPTYTNSSLNNATMTQLSGRIGGFHETIANAEIGTIFTGETGVFLVRESGEPAPIGDEILNWLRPEDPSILVYTDYWNAVIHDGHYKLAYTSNGDIFPLNEAWLNINKMKAMKGQPCWNGPHTGRGVLFSSTEERFNDNIIPKRIGTDDFLAHWYEADMPDVLDNFGVDRTYEFETRDFPIPDPNFNKIWTRYYWRMKIDQQISVSELTTVLNEQGEETESKTLVFDPIATHTGGTYPDFLTCRQKIYPFFPVNRLRGETIRKRFSITTDRYFAISGLSLFYRVEGRRI